MKDFKVQVPEGYEIDKEQSTFEKIVFKKVQKPKYPAKLEDLKENNNEEFFIDSLSEIDNVFLFNNRGSNKNQWTKREYAEAALALCQLVRLRDIYNDGEEVDVSEEKRTFYISRYNNKIETDWTCSFNRILSFHKEGQRDLFFENFRELIETAKPFL